MRNASLGDSDISDDSDEGRFNRRSYRSVQSPYRRRTSDRITNATASSRTVSGASRRKKTVPRKKTRVLEEIRRFQKSTNLLIPKLPFARLVREITLDITPDITRYSIAALEALQEATEMYITQLLQDASYLALHRKCVTITKGDIMLLRLLKYDF